MKELDAALNEPILSATEQAEAEKQKRITRFRLAKSGKGIPKEV